MCGSPRSLLQHTEFFCLIGLCPSDTGREPECLKLRLKRKFCENCLLNLGISFRMLTPLVNKAVSCLQRVISVHLHG